MCDRRESKDLEAWRDTWRLITAASSWQQIATITYSSKVTKPGKKIETVEEGNSLKASDERPATRKSRSSNRETGIRAKENKHKMADK